MGFLGDLGREVGRVVRESTRSTTGKSTKPAKRSASRAPTSPESERGPDPGTLLSAADIEAATGSTPVGEGDRRSGGQDLDTGYFRVCIWQLADGGQLLVNSCRLRGAEGEALWRSRWDDPSWQDVGNAQPVEGLGEAAKRYVTSSKGSTELHVSAKAGPFHSQVVHTSPAGSRDLAPLTELMRTLLTRLEASAR